MRFLELPGNDKRVKVIGEADDRDVRALDEVRSKEAALAEGRVRP
jgi:hypothetical protein